jgi:hypothetical protein
MEVFTMSAIAAELPHTASGELTITRHKVLVAGLGALMPIILNLLVVDLQTTFTRVTVFVLLAYGIRVAILFFLGGLMGFLHKEETSVRKLFELGIIAPALLTGVMNGTTNLKDSSLRSAVQPVAVTASLTDFFIPTAFAQSTEADVKTFTPPTESVASQLWRGLSGARSDDVYHVVVGTYPGDVKKALELARRIARQAPEYQAAVYKANYKNEVYYSVVIGANLSLDQANALRDRAMDSKIPTGGDIYVHNPWPAK